MAITCPYQSAKYRNAGVGGVEVDMGVWSLLTNDVIVAIISTGDTGSCTEPDITWTLKNSWSGTTKKSFVFWKKWTSGDSTYDWFTTSGGGEATSYYVVLRGAETTAALFDKISADVASVQSSNAPSITPTANGCYILDHVCLTNGMGWPSWDPNPGSNPAITSWGSDYSITNIATRGKRGLQTTAALYQRTIDHSPFTPNYIRIVAAIQPLYVGPPTPPSGLAGSCLIDTFPTADFMADTLSVEEGNTVTFTNLSSNAVSYAWDFGDGATSALEDPTHQFDLPGTFRVVMTATNSAGATASASRLVTVTPAAGTTIQVFPPMASFTASTHVGFLSGGICDVTFTNTSTGTISTYAWTFGDGGSSSSASPTRQYTSAGTYTVTLTVTGSGQTSTASTVIVIVNSAAAAIPDVLPPVATISVSAAYVNIGTPITFTASVSTTASYAWSFGDGGTSTDASPVYTYPYGGTYTVTLIVSNDFGSSSSTVSVTVRDARSEIMIRDYDWTFILNRRGHVVKRYNQAGTFDGQIGGFGTAAGKLNDPTSICVCKPKIT